MRKMQLLCTCHGAAVQAQDVSKGTWSARPDATVEVADQRCCIPLKAAARMESEVKASLPQRGEDGIHMAQQGQLTLAQHGCMDGQEESTGLPCTQKAQEECVSQ